VRAGTITCALEGWGESGVRADVAGRYLPPLLDSVLDSVLLLQGLL
jgi:hypothetical protein